MRANMEDFEDNEGSNRDRREGGERRGGGDRRGGFRRGGGDRRGGGFNRGFRNDFRPREMHKAKCAECGLDCEVPFKPTEGRPVFCKDCFQKRNPRNF